MSCSNRSSRALWLSLTTLVSACAGDDSSRTKVRIGAVIDRTGNNSDPNWRNSLELAERHVNQALADHPTLGDYRFDVVLGDSANEPLLVALPRAQALVREEGVKALLVDSSQNALAIHRTYYDAVPDNDLAVPLVCVGCGSSAIHDAAAEHADAATRAARRNTDGWSFRTTMSNRSIADLVAQLLMARGFSQNGDVNFDRQFKLGIYASNEIHGQVFAADLRAAVNARAADLGVPAVFEQVFHPTDIDPLGYSWREDLDSLTDALPEGQPDAIVVASFAEYHAAFVRNYRGSYSIAVLHAEHMRLTSVLHAVGTLGQGEEGVSYAVLQDDDAGSAFGREFSDHFGFVPGAWDANYYDSAVAIMLATLIAASGGDPTAVTGAELRAALPRTSTPGGTPALPGPNGIAAAVAAIAAGTAIDYVGASGPMDFDANNDVRSRLAHFRVDRGEFVDIETYDCISSPADCPAQR